MPVNLSNYALKSDLKKKKCWYIIICKIDLAGLKWNVDNLNIEEPKMFLII